MKNKAIQFIVSLCFFLAFFGTTVHAQGSGDSVQDMIQRCQDDAREINYCLGVGSGVSVMMMLNARSPGTFRICNVGRLSNGQIIRIFLNWADRNPKKWDAPAPIGFAMALEEAYPCK